MGCFLEFATLLFWICIISEKAELRPTWTSSPSNPTSVIENENLDLHWRFNTGGSLTFAKFLLMGDDQSEKQLIALKSSSNGSVNVDSAFRDRFIFNISNYQALVTLVAVQRYDSARYRFQIANQDLDRINNDVNIRVLFPPSITSVQCPSALTEGDNVKLVCNFTGNPLPSVVWNRANTRETLSNREILFIEDIKRSDSGRYECLAWNGIGNNSREFCEVDVNYPAQIMDISINQTVQLGKNVTLYCRVMGNPVPTISWTHKNNVGSGSELHFDSARFNDHGWYKCTAQNGIGSPATARTYLDVAERASNVINVKMTITNEEFDTSLMYEESRRYQHLSKRVIEVIGDFFRTDKNFKSVEILRFERGSVVVIFNLRFERTVRNDNIFSALKHAALDRKLGKFTIDPLSIMAPQDAIISATSSPRVSSSGSTWILVGSLSGSLLFLLFIAFAFWVCWRRWKKDKPSSRGNGERDQLNEDEAETKPLTGTEEGVQICKMEQKPLSGNEKSLQISRNKGILHSMDPNVLANAKRATYTLERTTSGGDAVKETVELHFY
ncbi:uncharacterized protein LOC111341014 isoform X2 [Stylophora pistillata]|uniref:uncharacterized protein LOC111341014 isoform X2 n=1 Tax=Stylophora pistillata TaxID=50429 RepID=UPI000C0488B7|nr:uncharacterized protein LOC111341014 isoform X2 [Stylophora pistillata]